MQRSDRVRRAGSWRSRWAAIGAAVAVTLGAGSIVAVNAASSEASSFVAVTPTRILDTRTDVGLAGPFVSGVSQKLQVTGTVPTQPPANAPAVNAAVVPASATSVVLNVTVVRLTTGGFLSLRPGNASGAPATSNINWGAGGAPIANSVTVQLPASGNIDVFVDGTVGHVLIDVAGYYLPGASGPVGDTGPAGPAGEAGPSPAQIVTVATADGDFASLSAALASITDASTSKPYLIRIAPGVYTEASTVTLKNHVDVEGSGERITTVTCACADADPVAGAAVSAGNITAQIRNFTITNTGGGSASSGLATSGVTDSSFSAAGMAINAAGGTSSNYAVFNNESSAAFSNVTATATGESNDASGVHNIGSSPLLNLVSATASGSNENRGIYNQGSFPRMNAAIARATGAGTNNYGVLNTNSVPSASFVSMNQVEATASGGTTNYGVKNEFTNTVMLAVVATGAGGSNGYGIHGDALSATSVRESTVAGDTNSIVQVDNVNAFPFGTMAVGSTQLNGLISTTGNFRCVGVYNEIFEEASPSCAFPI